MLMDYVKYSVLSQCELFVNAQHQSMLSLSQKVYLEHFEKNTEIFWQGKDNQEIGVLADGELEMWYTTPKGKHLPITKFGALGWFGSSALANDTENLVTVKTTRNSSVVFISKDLLMQAMAQDPVIMENVIRCLSNRISSISRFAFTYIDNDTLAKIGKQIISQVEMFSSCHSHSDEIELHLTKSHIASLIGQTRQSIVPYLNKYTELDLITFGYGTVKINNMSRLKKYINEMCEV